MAITAKKVNAGDDIKATDHNNLVDDVTALDKREPQKGDPGKQGEPGPNGKSAFEIAQDNGFEGTEEEWLASLKGPQGNPGTNGKDGAKGDPGKDGKDGAKGAPGADGKSVKALSLTTDDNGAVTSGKVTFSDDSTADITVS